MRIDNVDLKKISEVQKRVEENSETINQLVEDVVKPYVKRFR